MIEISEYFLYYSLMFIKITFLLSLALNGYLYFFHVKDKQTPLSSINQAIPEEEPLKRLLKDLPSRKNINSPRPLEKKAPTDEIETAESSETLFENSELTFNDQIIERLKYDFNLDEDKIQNYGELKNFYINATSNVFTIPSDHDPELPYVPTFEENKKYYNLVAEYHEKLQELLGPEKYQKYEKMRKENNQRVFLNWQEQGDTSNSHYMQF